MGALVDAELLARAKNAPGRFVLGPTSFAPSSTFPYGGISLGLHQFLEIQMKMAGGYKETYDPASGRIAEVGRSGVEYPELMFQIIGIPWDEDWIQTTFRTASSPGSNAYQTPPESIISGSQIPSTLQALPPVLLAAEDPMQPSIYFPRSFSLIDLSKACKLAPMEPAGFPMRLIPAPPATGADWQIGTIAQLTL